MTPSEELIVAEVAVLFGVAVWLSRLPSVPRNLVRPSSPVENASAWLLIFGFFTGFVLLAGSLSTRHVGPMFPENVRPVGLALIDISLVAILWQRLALERRKSPAR